MPTRKTKRGKRSVKVATNARAVAAFEAKLRDVLEASATINLCADPKVKSGTAKVPIRPVALARLSERLRHALVEAEAINLGAAKIADRQTKKVR